MNPIKLIDALRNSDEYIVSIYMCGGCYQFHLFLKAIFPESKPYLHNDRDHIATEINGVLYDIKGKIEFKEFYEPLNDEDLEMVEGWSFHKNNLLKLTDCPVCDEPMCV